MDALFERLSDEIDSTLMGMKADDWLRAPSGKWNVAQIVEHLSRAFGGTAKMLEVALTNNQHPQVGVPTLKHRMGRLLVIGVGYFPSGATAPAQVQPKGLEGEEALRRVRENIVRMDAALSEAEKRWGSGLLANHPVLGPLSACEWRKFHVLHGLHHLRQVRQRRKLNP
ncbi:MAG TPA: DUF1569 domain-containing protein [Candidatus Acidoferrales bacterium]|nr:DUF1569 domain-containing protein [Candidatus Acidoferrales bacterium]